MRTVRSPLVPRLTQYFVSGPALLAAALLSTIVLVLGPHSAAAATLEIGGKVTDQASNPIANCRVCVLVAGTITPAAPCDTTDAGGYYTVFVADGIYDVQVVPPAGSGFQSAITLNRPIAGATLVDFILVPPGVTPLSGRVLDALGNGVAGQYVSLIPPGGQALSVITDSLGVYSIQVGPGSYDMQVSGSANNLSANLPQNYYMQSTSALALAQSTVMDIPLPLKRVAIHVQDQAGNPVAGVQVSTSSTGAGNLTLGTLPAYGYSYYPNWGQQVVTNPSGDLTLWLFPSTPGNPYESFSFIPPPESGFAMFVLPDVSVTSDMTQVILLQTSSSCVPVALDFMPHALNLKSKGRWVTAFLTPPAPYKASQIEVGSIRLNGKVSANLATSWMRCSTTGRRRRAWAGIETYFSGLRGNFGWASGSALSAGIGRSPSSTALVEWQIRVVSRSKTGVSNRSLRSKAATVRSLASWLSLGSRQGILASLAKARLSCSFWLECMPGSSAETTTSPASAPVIEAYIRESAATLSPTCFMAASARRPAYAAPMATSSATFSLDAHSA